MFPTIVKSALATSCTYSYGFDDVTGNSIGPGAGVKLACALEHMTNLEWLFLYGEWEWFYLISKHQGSGRLVSLSVSFFLLFSNDTHPLFGVEPLPLFTPCPTLGFLPPLALPCQFPTSFFPFPSPLHLLPPFSFPEIPHTS